MVYLITGKAKAGKTHYANELKKELLSAGYKVKCLDGDVLRKETNNDDYSVAGREKNLIEAAVRAKKFEEEGNVVILSFVCPRKVYRDMMRKLWQKSLLIYIPGGELWYGTYYERPDTMELEIRRN